MQQAIVAALATLFMIAGGFLGGFTLSRAIRIGAPTNRMKLCWVLSLALLIIGLWLQGFSHTL